MLSHKQNQNNSCNYFVLSVLLSFPHLFSVLVWILYFLPFSYMFLVGWNTFILSWFLEYMEQKINIYFHFSILLLLPYRYDDCLRCLIYFYKNSTIRSLVVPPFSNNALPTHFLLLIATNKVKLRNTKLLSVLITQHLPK